MDSHYCLFQGIFPTQGSNPHLLHLLHWQGKFFTASATWEAPYFMRIRTRQAVLVVRKLPAKAGDLDSVPGLGRSFRARNGNPLQYSWLEKSMDRGAWWATVHGAPKSQTRLSTHTHTQHPKPSYLWKAPSSLQCRDPIDISQSTIHIYRRVFCATGGVNNIKSLLLRNPVSIIAKKEWSPSF